MGTPAADWVTESDLVVDDVTFRVAPQDRFASSKDMFCVVKRPDLVDEYRRLISDLAPERLVELGVLQGGSTALLALLARPAKLVAVELSPTRIPALDAFIADHGLGGSVHPYFGVDQSDQATLTQIIDDEFGDDSLDLVIDDASHEVEPTETSFNVLFPRLRPGGLYVVEDWSWAHVGFGFHRPNVEPLTTFVFEVLATLPQPRGLIDDIHITRDWVVIRRGPTVYDPSERLYDIRQICNDRGRDLVIYLRDRAAARRTP